MTHCNVRGSEAFVGDLSHIFLYEQANSAHIAGVQLSLLPNKPDGTYCLEALARKIRSDDVHEPISRLAVIENTHNLCGGKVYYSIYPIYLLHYVLINLDAYK